MSMYATPAAKVLEAAQQANDQLGHENLGFLSWSHGFMPGSPPVTEMPMSHKVWDVMATHLSDYYRFARVRQAFHRLPLLSADVEHLADQYLLRASAMLSIFAHAYVRAEPDGSLPLPDAILLPWQTVSARLGRNAPVLSYIDLIVYNWQLLDSQRADPMRVDNMRLLLPTVGNREEQIFYLTQTEMLAQCTPIVRASIRAQEATMRDEVAALKQELSVITDTLYTVTHGSFMQINPNPHSATYVDPVVWAKTVAPFAVPIHEGVQGPSGTSSPIFHLLDLFFERHTYASILGQESLHLRTWYPQHWQDFLAAVDQISLRDYVAAKSDRELTGLYQEALNAYAGEDGFLGRHRLKVYGYLELAFKIGRSVTIGGFSGLFQDRTWDEVDDALEASRLEREQRSLTGWHTVSTQAKAPGSVEDAPVAAPRERSHLLTLDVTGAGLRYQPGDRCCILPENDPSLVAKTLDALQADGTEMVLLNQVWRRALSLRHAYTGAKELGLQDLLRFGCIRPLGRDVAKLLYRMTAHPTLADVIESRAEDQWELWDLLTLLVNDGFEPSLLWRSHPADHESICWVVPPESYRMYSIASAAPAGGQATNLQLLAGQLRYVTAETPVSRHEERRGAGSSFVARLAQAKQPQPVAIKLVRPPRFHPTADPARHLVLFAGGTGVAPFRSFLAERRRQPNAGPLWLFYATRRREDLHFASELAPMMTAGQLSLRVAFSQEDIKLKFSADARGFSAVPGQRQRIDSLMLAPENAAVLWQLLNRDAVVYICGRASFARTVTETLKAILCQFGTGTADARARAAQQVLYRLVAEDRLHQEIYTTYTVSQVEAAQQFDISEIVLHNRDSVGHWIVLEGRVYDLSEFLHMHPGGVKILRGYTGMDGTPAYRKVLHHARPEVHAHLALYEIGVVRRLHFGASGGVVLTAGRPRYATLADAYRAWVRFLYLVVEMENALHNDFSIRDGILTEHETAKEHSTYKLQMMLEVYQRFLNNYIEGLTGNELTELWARIVGLCAPQEDVRWLAQQLATISQSTDKKNADTVTRVLAQRISNLQKNDNEARARLLDDLNRLETEAKRFLADFKLHLRDGLRIFETHEADTLQRGSQQLLTIMRQVPDRFAGYYTRIATGVARSQQGTLEIQAQK